MLRIRFRHGAAAQFVTNVDARVAREVEWDRRRRDVAYIEALRERCVGRESPEVVGEHDESVRRQSLADEIGRSPSGKPDYPWAQRYAADHEPATVG